MNIWTILGIAPTDELETIRRAYMSMLPKHNPEEDPEGFAQLRQAYELALKETKKTEPRPLEGMALFMERLEKLYADFHRRINIDEWKELLKDEHCVRLDLEDETSLKMLVFLTGHHYLPQAVWALLDEHFNWQEKPLLWQRFPSDFMDFVISSTQNENFDYNLFTVEPPQGGDCDSEAWALEEPNYERWIRLYYELDSALHKPDSPAFLELQREIEAMPIRHVYYDLLRARIFLSKGEAEEGLAISVPLLEAMPKDKRVRHVHALALLATRQPELALEHFKILQDKQGQIGALINLQRNEDARCLLLSILDEFPYDSFALRNFRLVTDRLIEEYEQRYASSPDDFETVLTLAKHYLNGQQHKKCQALLEDFEGEKSEEPRYYEYLADACASEGDYERAIKLYEKNIALEKKQRNYVKLVSGLIDAEKISVALLRVEEAMLLEDRDDLSLAYLLDNRGVIMQRLGQQKEALAAFDEAISINKHCAHIYIHKARSYEAMKRFHDAIKCCEQAISIYPYISEAWCLQMEIYYDADLFDKMLSLAERAEQMSFDSPRVQYHKACALRMLGQPQQAEELLSTLLAADFDEGYRDFFHVEAAYLALAEGHLDAAHEHITQAIQINDEYPYRFVFLGKVLYAKGEHFLAMQVYEKLLEKSPKFIYSLAECGDILMRCGVAYHKIGRHKESLECLLTAMEKKLGEQWNIPYVYTLIGLKYDNHFNDANNAMKYYKLALELDPNCSDAIANMADLYLFYHKNIAEAMRLYEQALVLDQENPHIYLSRGLALWQKRRYIKARHDFVKAQELFEESGAKARVAFCHLCLRRYSLAQKMFLELLEAGENVADGYYGLGMIAERKRRYKEAKALYEKALSLANSILHNSAFQRMEDYT